MFIPMKAKSEQRKKKGACEKDESGDSKIPRCHVHVSTQTKLTGTAIYPCCQKGNDLRDPFDRQGVIRLLHCFFWFLTRREQRWTMLRRKMLFRTDEITRRGEREMTPLFVCKCGDAGGELEESCSCPRAHLFVGW